MHFYYNPVTEEVRRMCWNQGDWRFYHYYEQWQRKTAEMAREICRKERIDILHQLNMIGFREPGYLWRVSRETGIPFVWGPVDAKERFPMAYVAEAPLKTRVFLRLKNIITTGQLRYGRRVHQAARTAAVVISASSNSVESFMRYFGIESLLMNETGTYPTAASEERWSDPATFDIVWVGKMDFRKQLGLAIRSVATAFHRDIRLHIVGSGNVEGYLHEAEKQGIADLCVIHGSVSHDEVLRLMRSSDLFLFTSVAEGTSTVIMEALQNDLPVLCFDTCGMSAVMTDEVGYKIPLSNPERSAKEFGEKIEYLYRHREVLEEMSRNCRKRAEELSWENKARKMVELYEEIL